MLRTVSDFEEHHKKLCIKLEEKENHKIIVVCGGTGCASSKSLEIEKKFKKIISSKDIHDVEVSITGCFGFCERGPIVDIEPSGNFLLNVGFDDVEDVIESYIQNNETIERLMFYNSEDNKFISEKDEIPFYKKQKRIALRNCGVINPEKIDEYILNGGYQAIKKVLFSLTSNEVIEEVKKSQLRGRGGGGFPTGLKWEITSKVQNEKKYVICNADEGDPGAFMDRSILEGDPHGVIEGMMIAGYAVGSDKGIVYIRAEYPLAINRLKIALEQARDYKLLGEDILGSGFNFDIEIKLGAGAFVCGEETALIQSMEGKRGEPTYKPPYPSESGYWGKPTNVNNVETFANVPKIISNGADWFKQFGTEKSPGTKVFALAGMVKNVGLVEVPMGTTLREVIFDIGGGILNGKKFKAVQTGGPSGGCLTEDDLDTPIDFDNLIAKGSMMGSGGMIVMDEENCMVDVAKFFLDFTVEESCGKCTPCRTGTKRLLEILEIITKGKGEQRHLNELNRLSHVIKNSALCGLGQSAPNPVLSTLKKFKIEYEKHVYDKSCPAKVCQDLITYRVIEDKCIGCTACARVCPTSCISGKVKEIHLINQEDCIKCGACFTACKFAAIEVK